MSALLRLFPRDWRAAYGDEVADMLASSAVPWRDRAGLVRAAVTVRADQLGDLLAERTDLLRYLGVVALGLIAIGLAGGGWAATRLADGVVEIPGHWWSTPWPCCRWPPGSRWPRLPGGPAAATASPDGGRRRRACPRSLSGGARRREVAGERPGGRRG